MDERPTAERAGLSIATGRRLEVDASGENAVGGFSSLDEFRMIAATLDLEHQPKQCGSVQGETHIGNRLRSEGQIRCGVPVGIKQSFREAAKTVRRDGCEQCRLVGVMPVRGHGGNTGATGHGAEGKRLRSIFRQQLKRCIE